MRARDLVDSQFVTLDLGEHLEVEGFVLPRYSTWQLNKFGIPSDLISLSQLLPIVAKKTISESLSKEDRAAIERIVQRELKAFEKQDKKDDMVLIKNALISLFKAFYTKRSFWSSDVSGDRSS